MADDYLPCRYVLRGGLRCAARGRDGLCALHRARPAILPKCPFEGCGRTVRGAIADAAQTHCREHRALCEHVGENGERCNRRLTTKARIDEGLCVQHRRAAVYNRYAGADAVTTCEIYKCGKPTRGASRCYAHKNTCTWVCPDGGFCDHPLRTPARVAEQRCCSHRKSVTEPDILESVTDGA